MCVHESDKLGNISEISLEIRSCHWCVFNWLYNTEAFCKKREIQIGFIYHQIQLGLLLNHNKLFFIPTDLKYFVR